eukprot:CAMPEP_0202901574 /NCGR_PEP_ID=MMETSP1392-20130828/14331_1 /ASSEMBLY_ACC=CAM_ASM_000868 /TAXON_ID=225041 /ORGANISM="Chlamydomonas chlamydogama, Strain SAG 11-48b" /LENGTH=281 /DNA_ID=CAMNT_0049588157 /DNA_START=225 /DNA_END=1071 /DNA_ORIENTATION=+
MGAGNAKPQKKLVFDPLRKGVDIKIRCNASEEGSNGSSPATPSPTSSLSDAALPDNFCIIESREAVQDFEDYDSQEIADSIQVRRNRIFLLMEEVRRLRIQQRLKGVNPTKEQELAQEKFVSALPFLPPLEEKTLNLYFYAYATMFAGIIVFGGILAPILEVKLGLGGTSYLEFVQSMHLPSQLAQVDPIVASFCGGAVGVLSALLLVEVMNIKSQQKNRCHYCQGTGYLMCGNCVGSGLDPVTKDTCRCCAKTGKVMCTGCLCTGKALASEHDIRIDPWS